MFLAQRSPLGGTSHSAAHPAALGRCEPAGRTLCPASEPPLLAQPASAGSSRGRAGREPGLEARTVSILLLPQGPWSQGVPSFCPQNCRLMQTGGTGTLPASPAQPECAVCCPNSNKQAGEFGLHEGLLSQPAPAPHSFSPKPAQTTKAGNRPRDPTTSTRGLQTRVGFIHGHGGSCVTGSCTRIAHPATRVGGYPCHVTTQRQHYRTSGRVQAPSPPSRLGSGLGYRGLTKTKDPSTHR